MRRHLIFGFTICACVALLACKKAEFSNQSHCWDRAVIEMATTIYIDPALYPNLKSEVAVIEPGVGSALQWETLVMQGRQYPAVFWFQPISLSSVIEMQYQGEPYRFRFRSCPTFPQMQLRQDRVGHLYLETRLDIPSERKEK